jgi:hypothetical protein
MHCILSQRVLEGTPELVRHSNLVAQFDKPCKCLFLLLACQCTCSDWALRSTTTR